MFEDVKHRDGAFDLPDLKLRELIFIGALKRTGAGSETEFTVAVDPARPMPPFREEGLFPPNAAFRVERRGGRAYFRILRETPEK